MLKNNAVYETALFFSITASKGVFFSVSQKREGVKKKHPGAGLPGKMIQAFFAIRYFFSTGASRRQTYDSLRHLRSNRRPSSVRV